MYSMRICCMNSNMRCLPFLNNNNNDYDNNHIRFAEAIAGVFYSANRPRSHKTKQNASSCAIGRVLEIMRIIVHVGRCTLNGKIAFACFYPVFLSTISTPRSGIWHACRHARQPKHARLNTLTQRHSSLRFRRRWLTQFILTYSLNTHSLTRNNAQCARALTEHKQLAII